MTAIAFDLFRVPPSNAPMPIELPVGRACLPSAFAGMGFNRGAEIGVWEGRFSEQFCLSNPSLELTCVDPWRSLPDYVEGKNRPHRMAEAYAAAKKRLGKFNCTFLRMTSLEAAQQIPNGSLDFIYIDGNHLFDHVIADLNAWVPKVRSGGVVAGHDYAERSNTPFIQVKKAVDHYTREHQIDPWFVLLNDKSPSYVWVVR